MPKKPLSSYIYFSQQIRDEIKKEKSDLSVNELMKEISARWQKASEEEKAPYNEMAHNDKKRYEDELNQYKKNVKSKTKTLDTHKESIARQRSVNNDFSNRSPPNEAEYVPGRGDSSWVMQGPVRQSSNKSRINVEPIAPNVPGASNLQKERRSKKHYDYAAYRQPPVADEEFMSPPNNDYFEQRSASNNRGMEDRVTERSNKDSMMFPFNDDDDKE
jgi:hypothetical protein